MKISTFSLVLATAAVVLTGCQNPDGTQNNTGGGALIGGAFGAIAGAALGGRNAGAGALIGGLSGALVGGLIGNSMDQEQQARLRAEAPQTYVKVTHQQPLTVADVKALSKAGVAEDTIISQITSTHTGFRLSSAEIIDLRDSGVSDKVINFMINTAGDPTANNSGSTTTEVVTSAPPPPPAETVVVASPGPDYVWMDGEWVWSSGRWIWIGGHWGYPPHPHVVWVSGGWDRGPHGWYRRPGYWR
jgi:uncharacterized protein YcfJ